jgi:PE family
MSWVNAAPEYVAAAANDLAGIGSTLSSANALAAFPTSAVMAAGADEVSAGIAALFAGHAQAYQAISAQAALFHNQFVDLMTAGAGQYAGTEALNALPMQPTHGVTSDPGMTALSSAPSAAAAQGAAPGAGWFGASGAGAGVTGTGGGATGLLPNAGITGSAVAAPAAAAPAHAAAAGSVGGGWRSGFGGGGFASNGGTAPAADLNTDEAAGLGGAGGMALGPGAIGANAMAGIPAPIAANGAAAGGNGGQAGGNTGHGEAAASASHSAWMYGHPEAGDVPAEATEATGGAGHGGLHGSGHGGFYGSGGSTAQSAAPAVSA